jgi:hypothetical protein
MAWFSRLFGARPKAEEPPAEARLARTDAEEQRFQNLLVERECELMNVENVPGRDSSHLVRIETQLRELGWDGVEQTRHP